MSVRVNTRHGSPQLPRHLFIPYRPQEPFFIRRPRAVLWFRKRDVQLTPPGPDRPGRPSHQARYVLIALRSQQSNMLLGPWDEPWLWIRNVEPAAPGLHSLEWPIQQPGHLLIG